MKLIEWTSIHIDYLNSYKKDLLEKKVLENKILCKYKHSEQTYFVEENLEKIDFEKVKQGVVIIVCLNSKENLKCLIKNWQTFIKNPKLKVMFVNLIENQKWSVIPCVHNKITEQSVLKSGLESLLNSISSV